MKFSNMSTETEKSHIKENEDKENLSTSGTPSANSTESKAKLKLEKVILHEFEVNVKEIRAQLADQLKCVGERTETQIAVLGELEDFFRKRGEVEAEHARQLEKLAKGVMQKHKAEKNRRESWSQHAACNIWQQLVDDTKEEAIQRQAISDLYQKVLTTSISSRCDDLARISKKCREIGAYSHSEINRVLTELHTSMKTYQLCHSEFAGVEKKLRLAEEEKRKYEEANPGKNLSTRKYRSLVKYLNKREEKFDAIRTKCAKARNEYLMCIRAANAALHRFFSQDLSYLIDCMDLGMDFWIKSMLEQIIDVRKKLSQSEMDALAELGTQRSAVDSKADKQRFFESHHATFMLPKQFEFRAQLGDAVSLVSAEKGIALELAQRKKQIEKRLEALRFETDEVWKSLEAAERQLHQLYCETVEDLTKWRNDVMVTYQYYLKKFEFFLLNGNLIDRLEARSKSIAEALLRQGASSDARDSIPSIVEELRRRQKTRRIGSAPSQSVPRPRLFGGSLDEYVEQTGECIPLVVTSAVNYLSRFSLRNQGLFRVSGSQSEINRFKDAYEKGDDAFAYLTDGSESNSVAGVLKLYLRELREPLFPIFLFDQFTDCAKTSDPAEFIRKSRELIEKLPLSHVLLLRFLFGFLSHLCEFADENMMEPHNMAICFGPTLLPIPEGKDQVFYHNYVNELVRSLIVHSFEVFPSEDILAGPVYDKYSVTTEPEHIGYMDEGDVMSDDDECLKNGNCSTEQMLDSTYEMSIGTDVDANLETAPIPSPRTTIDSQPSISSRSSNRSAVDDYFRRMSEDVSPVSRTEISHRIANELTTKFDRCSDAEKDVLPISPTNKPIWEVDRPSSHSSNYSSHSHSITSLPTRMPVMTSLRDQLHHIRKELNNGREVEHKIHPMPTGVSHKACRLSLHDDPEVLDARGGIRVFGDREPRSVVSDFPGRLSSTPLGECIEVEERNKQHKSLSSNTPDLVASACNSARSVSEHRARAPSPPLDELSAALHSAAISLEQ